MFEINIKYEKNNFALLLFFGFLSNSNAQVLKKIIELETNTSRYKSDVEIPDTIVYNFKSNKLLSSLKTGGSLKKYAYNDKGLLSKISESQTKYPDSGESIEEFEYDSNGFLVGTSYYRAKNGVKTDGASTSGMKFEYQIKNDNEFTITGNGTGTNSIIQKLYVMKNNVLTVTMNVGKIKTISVYNFKDGNVISANINKNTRENHTLLYTYDATQTLNETIFKNLFGEKYFYALLCSPPEITLNNSPQFSKNIMKSSALEKQIKVEIGIITDNVKIDYNSNNFPVKSVNTAMVTAGSDVSPRFLIEQTYFYE